MSKFEPPYRPLDIVGSFLISAKHNKLHAIRYSRVNYLFSNITTDSETETSEVSLGLMYENTPYFVYFIYDLPISEADSYAEKLLRNAIRQLAETDKY